MAKKNYGKANCIVCGTEFQRTNGSQRFCSADCRIKHHNAARYEPKEMTCKHCGKVFFGNRKKKFCSDECCYQEELEKRRKKKRKKQNSDVSEIAVKAQVEGLSYGKYVAKYGL